MGVVPVGPGTGAAREAAREDLGSVAKPSTLLSLLGPARGALPPGGVAEDGGSGEPAPKKARPAGSELEDPYTGLRIRDRGPSRKEVDEVMKGMEFIPVGDINPGRVVRANARGKMWVTGGALCSVGNKSENGGRRFAMIELTSLSDHGRVRALLTGPAFEAFHALPVKTVILVKAPSVLPPRDSFKATTEEVTFKFDDKHSILVLGEAMDMMLCQSTTKAGQPCRNWVDARRSKHCNFHAAKELKNMGQTRPALGIGKFTSPLAPGGARRAGEGAGSSSHLMQALGRTATLAGGLKRDRVFRATEAEIAKAIAGARPMSQGAKSLQRLVDKDSRQGDRSGAGAGGADEVGHPPPRLLGRNHVSAPAPAQPRPRPAAAGAEAPPAPSSSASRANNTNPNPDPDGARKKRMVLLGGDSSSDSGSDSSAADNEYFDEETMQFKSRLGSTRLVMPELSPEELRARQEADALKASKLAAAKAEKEKADREANLSRVRALVMQRGGIKAPDPNQAPVDMPQLAKPSQAPALDPPPPSAAAASAASLPPSRRAPASSEAYRPPSALCTGVNVDAMLAAKAIHQADGRLAKDEALIRSLDPLVKKDQLEMQLESIMEEKVEAWKCTICRAVTKRFPEPCKTKGHAIVKAHGIRRFFFCDGCHKKCETFNAIKPSSCAHCRCLQFTQTSKGAKKWADPSGSSELKDLEERKIMSIRMGW